MRINALGNTATDFASDDYIALDGTTNGSRKMAKAKLLEKTAKNALESIKTLSDTATYSDINDLNYMALDTANGAKKIQASLFSTFSQLMEKTYMIIEVENDGLFVIDEELNIGAAFTNEGFFCSNVLNFIAED